ncbi:hypothetical protein LguiA_035680 [Lonicera macranthoides]
MDSPQSVVSPFKNSSGFTEQDKQNTDLSVKNSACKSRGIEIKRNEAAIHNLESFIGILDVYIHQARDIHNICIYQKQDVYAKLFLSSDPEKTVSTQIINGGGQNPVFNEHIRLNVRSVDCSLKCEIWMLSRVRNYLEDQLLGFALVPLSEVVLKNGSLNKEFSLSSTDLFHSPAGFVQLSLSYSGATPEVMAIPAPPPTEATDADVPNSEVSELLASEFDKIEFPDPNIVSENHMMVSEYYGIQSSDSLVSSDTENHPSPKIDSHAVEDLSKGIVNSVQISRPDSPPSSISTNGSPCVSLPASCQSSDTPRTSKSPNEAHSSIEKENPQEKNAEAVGGESDGNAFAKPIITINIEPEQKVVQQDFVDMYMKSFTESLAKMKLPLDMESGQTSSTDSSSDQKLETPKSTGSRVFYGSRAFF